MTDKNKTDTLKRQIKILVNTIATGEANEAECYRAIEKCLRRIDVLKEPTV